MIKQKVFNDSQEINVWISFYFFQKLDLSMFVDLEKIQPWVPDTLGVNFEVLNLLYLCLDCHEFCFKWWSKRILMVFMGKIFEFHFIFSRNWILLCLWTSKNFNPDTLGVNFEVLKHLHLCMDSHEVCFKWYSKKVFMIPREIFFFLISFHSFQKLDLTVFVDLEKIQPWLA